MYSRFIMATCALLAALVPFEVSAATGYPTKPVTIIVPFAAGGATDLTVRFIADYATKKFGQNVIVDNRTGAGGAVAINALARSAPDGYTLSIGATSQLVVLPHTQGTPYKPDEDIEYIAKYVAATAPLAVRKDAPWNSFADILAYAQANPGKFRWSGAAPRGVRHITLEAAFQKEKVETTYVPYQGGSQTLLALQNGEIDAIAVAEYASAFKSGDIKLIVRTDPNPIEEAPDLPSLRDLGYALAPEVFYAVIGPRNVPEDILSTWREIIEEVGRDPEFEALCKRLQLIPRYESGVTFKAAVNRDYEAVGAAIKSLNLQ